MDLIVRDNGFFQDLVFLDFDILWCREKIFFFFLFCTSLCISTA